MDEPGAPGPPAPAAPTEAQAAAAAAARTLALLDEQTQTTRVELARLQEDLLRVQRDISGSRASQLLEANEQLVITALRAEEIAEAAMHKLAELAQAAQRDPLTGTPGRLLMRDRMEAAITRARRQGTRLALIFLDLDHFKQINDTHGHAAGDAVLVHVARRLEASVRDSDTVSRHGGDEFLVLLAEVAHGTDAQLIGSKIVAELAQPAAIDGRTMALTASLGIAVYPDDGSDATTLVERADAAMYRSKRRRIGSDDFQRPEAADSAEPPAILPAAAPPPATAWPGLAAAEPLLGDLRAANESLVLAALTAQHAETQAQEAYQRQVKFLAMVAHELRNPLTPIRTAAELLERAHASDQALLMRLQGIIKRQVDHMTRLVEDLLDGSRISAGKFRLQRSTVELGDTLGIAVDACRPALDRKHHLLVIDLPPAPFTVLGDPVRLAQVFTNLLDNACKYTHEGGEIGLSVAVQGSNAVITVSDNGIGMAPHTLTHVFDLFAQNADALAVHSGGLGIGLAVVRELVEAHGGTVVARSAGSEQGSQFVVTLPGGASEPDGPARQESNL